MYGLQANTLLLLHFTFMLRKVKMPLKGEVGSHAFNTVVMEITLLIMEIHGKNHGIVF